MDGNERLWVITLGAAQKLGLPGERGGELSKFDLYYAVDSEGEKCIPVFTTSERLEAYVRVHLNSPEAHMDLMEGGGETLARKLTEERFHGALMDVYGIAECAVEIDADYLVRDPRPGDQQEVLRVLK